MSQNANLTQDDDSKSKKCSNLDLLNIDEGDIQIRSNLNVIELDDAKSNATKNEQDRQSDFSKTGHGWIKDKDFHHQNSLKVDLQGTQSTMDGLLGGNFADRVK